MTAPTKLDFDRKVDPLAVEVRQILFAEWDPVGINMNADMIDEYDYYVPEIYILVYDGRPASEIAAQLELFHTTCMGWQFDPSIHQRVAEKLYSLGQAFRSI